MKTAPEVLFVCVHNAGRSQMAAAFLHHQWNSGVMHVQRSDVSAGATGRCGPLVLGQAIAELSPDPPGLLKRIQPGAVDVVHDPAVPHRTHKITAKRSLPRLMRARLGC